MIGIPASYDDNGRIEIPRFAEHKAPERNYELIHRDMSSQALEVLLESLGDGNGDPGSVEHNAALVVLSMVHLESTDVSKLSAFTGVGKTEVCRFKRNLKNSGYFDGRKMRFSDWSDEQHGGIAFAMDACVALGWMERTA